MTEVNKSAELNNTDKKLHISDVISRIQERIRSKEKDIELSREIIANSNGVMINQIELNVKLIKEAEIRISELKAVLEYCL